MKTEEKNIGELVAQNYRTAAVFKKYKIDFCCNGNRSILEACQAKNIDVRKVAEEIEEAEKSTAGGTIDFNAWDLDLLTDYIEKKHHRYVEQTIPVLLQYLDKLRKVHGPQHPELMEIHTEFNECAGALTAHMKKEELILFPFIRNMVKARQLHQSLQTPSFQTVENPIHMMMHEHDVEGERFRKIAELSNEYTPPADACGTYSVTFSLLKEFEDDLHAHIHLENNILFPKAVKLEAGFHESVV
jgi:regulator of cell morphogenesis and NO signaling